MPRKRKILQVPIYETGITTRTLNQLVQLGVNDTSDLSKLNRDEIEDRANVGLKTIAEIDRLMEQYGQSYREPREAEASTEESAAELPDTAYALPSTVKELRMYSKKIDELTATVSVLEAHIRPLEEALKVLDLRSRQLDGELPPMSRIAELSSELNGQLHEIQGDITMLNGQVHQIEATLKDFTRLQDQLKNCMDRLADAEVDIRHLEIKKSYSPRIALDQIQVSLAALQHAFNTRVLPLERSYANLSVMASEHLNSELKQIKAPDQAEEQESNGQQESQA